VLSHPGRFAGKRVCVVVSGGNVDAEVFEALTRG
jgi:threonine dehydratase